MSATSLPTCESYRLESSHHTGGLENAETCANCGRAIVEVAILSDSHGNSHRVGMDCAETLCGKSMEYLDHSGLFQEARSFSAKLRKARKSQPQGRIEIHEYKDGGYYQQGGFLVEFGALGQPGSFSANKPAHYAPYILPLCKN